MAIQGSRVAVELVYLLVASRRADGSRLIYSTKHKQISITVLVNGSQEITAPL